MRNALNKAQVTFVLVSVCEQNAFFRDCPDAMLRLALSFGGKMNKHGNVVRDK